MQGHRAERAKTEETPGSTLWLREAWEENDDNEVSKGGRATCRRISCPRE